MDSSKGFAFTGPRHMMPKAEAGSSPTNTTEIDWDNEEHRRCITACLIKGTYVLESERTKLREAGNDTCEEALALAPAWWESFHFRRFRVLACECECVLCQVGRHIVAGRSPRFTYGVIFEYVPPDGPRWHPSAPSYVVAFRGTMRRDATNLGDMRLDLRILLNAHHSCGRFSHAREEVGKFLDSVMPSGGGAGSSCVVWLAGHSLGASIALDVGRHMMTQRGLNISTFLFNPPQVSLPAVTDNKLHRRGVCTPRATSSSTDSGKFSSPTRITWRNSSSSCRRGCPTCTCTSGTSSARASSTTSSSGSGCRSGCPAWPRRAPPCPTGTCAALRSACRTNGRTSCHPRCCGRTRAQLATHTSSGSGGSKKARNWC